MRDAFAMNEARAAHGVTRIVLAQEKRFRLAGTLVQPASLELEFQSETTLVEPRVMQVLVALSRAGGEPTSRKQLIQCCWGGRPVTDGALNRSIAQLRKALRDPGIQISTIPRVGYRLQTVSPTEGAAVDLVPTRGATAAVTRRPAFSGRGVQVVAVVAVALLALALVTWGFMT